MKIPAYIFTRQLSALIATLTVVPTIAQSATTLVGDHAIAANPSASPAQTGDLTVAGSIASDTGVDFGKLASPSNTYGAMMTYDLITRSTLLDSSVADASVLWRQDTATGTALSKMALSGFNNLSLFKTDGSAAGITLDPNAGAITLAGVNSGIYNAQGNPILSISSSGQLSFPVKPVFQNGIDFGGNAGSLDGQKITYLQRLLSNFGYQENPVTATTISQLDVSGVYDLQIAQAPAGGLFIAGTCSGGARVGWYTLGGNGAFVARLYANGSVQWLRKINTTGYMYRIKLASHTSGGLAVSGSFYQDATFQNPTTTLVSKGHYDGFAFKLSPDNGSVIWGKSFGGTSYDDAQAIAIGASGDVVVGGNFSQNFLAEDDTNLFTTVGSYDGFVMKLASANGALAWAQRIGGSSYDIVTGVAIDSVGNAYASGNFNGTAALAGGSPLVSAGSQDGFIAKLGSADGAQIWRKRMGGSSYDSATAVAVDSAGSPVVIGTFQNSMTSENSGLALNGAGQQDGYVCKLNPATGAATWGTTIGGASSDSASSLAIDSGDNILVGGHFDASMTAVNGGTPLLSKGYRDGYLVKYSPTGNVLTTQAIGGTSYDSVSSVTAANSRIYLSGYLGTSTRLGSTVIQGNFSLHWDGSPIVTPDAPPAQSFAWNGGVASGQNSFASGSTSMAAGTGSTAFGGGIAIGQNSFATGGAKANQSGSFAHGPQSEASGSYSVAIGGYNKASGQSSVAIGSDLKALSYGTVALGAYNKGITSDDWNLQSIFELGNGDMDYTNAITTLRNGQTTLTNLAWQWNPTAPLADPQWSPASYSHGEALVVEGHTRLKGRVIIEQPQGDISMGNYQ